MPKTDILYEIVDSILTITINRPEKKNAFTTEMYQQIIQVLGDARKDDAIRVVLIRGHTDCFSAGNDLKNFRNRDPGVTSPGIKMLETLASFEKPVVAAVSGVAVGVGATMLLHCDLVYAASGTRFRLPFVQLGIVPEGASTLLIPAKTGHRRAAELLLLGDFFGPGVASEAGIITEELDIESVFDHARAVAGRLADQPPEALLETKRLMKRPVQTNVLETIELERQALERLLATSESEKARKSALS